MVVTLVCCADAASAQKVVAPPITLKTSRRLMQVLPRRTRQILSETCALRYAGARYLSVRIGRGYWPIPSRRMVNGPFGILGAVPLGTSLGSAQFDCGGRLEVTVDSERRILGPGDAYYFESRRPHRFRCVGAKPCELISACTPPTFCRQRRDRASCFQMPPPAQLVDRRAWCHQEFFET